jgi:hypothetical protein
MRLYRNGFTGIKCFAAADAYHQIRPRHLDLVGQTLDILFAAHTAKPLQAHQFDRRGRQLMANLCVHRCQPGMPANDQCAFAQRGAHLAKAVDNACAT